MEVDKFYKIDPTARSLILVIDVSNEGHGMSDMYSTIVFGMSTPPRQNSIYDARNEEATDEEIDRVLKYRYTAMFKFVFEELIVFKHHF